MKLILFADDTSISMSDNRLDIINDKVKLELCKISTWFKINKLSLNVKKTKFLLYTSKKSHNLKQLIDVKMMK